MIIYKNSWHYRLIRWWDIEPSNSLCVYFWQVVVSLVIKPFCGILFLAMLAVIGLLFVAGLITAPLSLVGVIQATKGSLLELTNFLGAAIYVIFPVIVFLKSMNQRKNSRSLIRQYLKAKKDKVCPVIVFSGSVNHGNDKGKGDA